MLAKENHNKRSPAPLHPGSGYGGKMSDSDVRSATLLLEAAIVEAQRKRGWKPFAYRTEPNEDGY